MDHTTHGTDKDIDPTLTGLLHPDKDARQRTAMSLGQRADPRLAAQIAELRWQEPDFFVRETLTWVLTRTPGPAAEAAEAVLAHGDPGVRMQALHVLSKVADPATVTAVAAHIDDADPAVADKARWGLAQIGDPLAIPMLIGRLGEADLSARDAMTRTLTHLGAAAVPGVASALTAQDPSVRAHAAEVLCFIGPPSSAEAIPALASALDDDHAEVRLSAAMALRDLVENPAAHKALHEASLDSPDPRVQSVARASV